MLAIFLIFLRLGCTSFGGPVAHLGYFREEFVTRRAWLSERSYAEWVAVCQFLPGPASSQVGFALGLLRGGLGGGLAAWLGFTLPSALLMTLAGLGLARFPALLESSVVHGLKLAAVAVVAQALWAMQSSLCPCLKRRLIALTGLGLALALPGVAGQWLALGAGLLTGRWLLTEQVAAPAAALTVSVPRWLSRWALVLLVTLLLGLALLANGTLAEASYRAGASVFGGGHVVLPMLEAALVPELVSRERFLAGYGLTQAMPGPLFSFVAYLGAQSGGLPAAALALLLIFLPGLLLVLAVLPIWQTLRTRPGVAPAMAGINAAVVGLLAAAFWDPVLVSGVRGVGDGLVAAVAAVLLQSRRVPVLAVVLACPLFSYSMSGV